MAINMLNLIMLILLYIINLAHKERRLHIIGFIFLILMIWFLLVLLLFHLIIVLTLRTWRLLEVSLIDQTLIKLLLLFLLLFFLVYFYLIFLLLCLERGASLVGLYSFYKIIKDVVKSILGNKAWRYTLIIALIVLVFTVFSSKVNAEELHDYVVDYYTTYNFTQGEYTHQLVFVPVFANSSYAISWASGNLVTFSFIDNLSRENNAINFPMSTISTNDQGSFGYFATKDGYLVLDHYSTNFSHPTYNITTDYDFSSNLATIHQDLHQFLYGDEDSSLNPSVSSGLIASYSGTFINYNGSSTLYFPVKNGYKYSLSFDYTSTPGSSPIDMFRFGYSSSAPSSGVAYTSIKRWDTINFSRSYSFTATQDSYFYISYFTSSFSNFKISSNYNPSQTGGINQQIINQAEETRETLTDSNISQDSADYSLPSDSTTDITQDGFGSIFDRIRSTFTSGSATPITITIPFTNRSFTISKQSVFGSANLGIVGTLIQSFWWFVVSLFIVKDIFKKIEAIKSGNIEFAETTNIKEDIL